MKITCPKCNESWDSGMADYFEGTLTFECPKCKNTFKLCGRGNMTNPWRLDGAFA